MFSISMKTNLSLVLRSSHINLIQIKKKEATKNLYKLIIVYHGMWYCVKKTRTLKLLLNGRLPD